MIIPIIKVILYIITSTGASPHVFVEQQPPKLGLLATLSAFRDENTVHTHATITSVINIKKGLLAGI
jgi:hypothetical protein